MWSSRVNSVLTLGTGLLDWAAKETRILVTIDTDFGQLIYLENLSHAGLVRLPMCQRASVS